MEHPLRTEYVLAAISEGMVGGILVLRPRLRFAWISACVLSGFMFLYAWIGPPLRDCLCLGFLAELGSRGRSVVAGALFAIALAGTGMSVQKARYA